MTDQEFRLRADQALRDLHEALAAACDRYEFEADYGDALTVEFSDPPAKFVVSPNAPVKQIWISALARSYKLAWSEARNGFVLPETGETLKEIMAVAVSRQLGEQIEL
ncbi:MAG: iron donor protein CyaY [Acidobacteria bacterium]|nr:iron donor protein CyaY [Acidobacteriota bacterium]